MSRPGAPLRHPQESNPEVIREVSVGRSEKKRAPSREAVGARSTQEIRAKRSKEGRKEDEADDAEEEEKEEGSSDPLRFFLLLFGEFSATHKLEGRRQEGAGECDEENVGPIRAEKEEWERQESGSRRRTRKEEGRVVEVSDRQAKLARPSRGLADVK